MTKLYISLGIGLIAGLIDIIPMIVKKIDKYSTISAFVHWIILGFVISYIQLPIADWLKGVVIAEISALPIVILVLKTDAKSMVPIMMMSALLGCLVGISTGMFAI